MFNESIVFAAYVGFFAAILALIFVWLEGVYYMIRDLIDNWNRMTPKREE